MIKRYIVDIALLIGIFFLPWWLILAIATICLFLFTSYYEILVLGIIIDSFYNAPVARWADFQFIVTLIALIVFILAAYLKTRLRYFEE